MADGNFTADHLRQKSPQNDMWLIDGEGMMAGRKRYMEHLKTAVERHTVRRVTCFTGNLLNVHSMRHVNGTSGLLISQTWCRLQLM